MRIGSMQWKGEDNMRYESGMTILECKDFAPFLGACCGDCHRRATMVSVNLSRGTGLFIVRPPPPARYEQEWMADFSLHITAHVCCHIVCRVVNLPHSWWVEKAKELNTEETWRLHVYGHKAGLAGYQEATKEAKKPRRRTTRVLEEDDSELGGLATWR